jgi:betaine/carnitine transporter, BCCT family
MLSPSSSPAGGAKYQKAAAMQLSSSFFKVSLTTFQMLENLPFAEITTFVGILLVLIFFITSSDSGSLVIDSITAGGKLDSPAPQRIFWAVIQGLIAGVLLYGGGQYALSALQAGTVATGIPFTLVLIFISISLFKGLRSSLKEDRVNS